MSIGYKPCALKTYPAVLIKKRLIAGDVQNIRKIYIMRSTLDNLKAAAAGEHEEWTEMYREFSEVAAAEGFAELSRQLARVAEIEKRHENRYNKLIENLEKGEVYVKTGPQRWECRNCGHIHIGDKAPELCPTCKHPQSYFEIEATHY